MITLILSGGAGTRFWPVSTKSFPKQYLTLFNHKSMIRLTFERVLQFTKLNDIFIITTQDQNALVKEHLPELKEYQIINEPYSMNTAPCITYALLYLKNLYQDQQSILILPSDHYIPDSLAFNDTIQNTDKIFNRQNKTIIFGIKPYYPATGYGYIQIDSDNTNLLFHVKHNMFKPSTNYQNDQNFFLEMFHVKHFKEKPSLDLAVVYINQSEYFWNSGMIYSEINYLLERIKYFGKNVFKICEDALNSKDVFEAKSIYLKNTKEPIDIMLLEKINELIMIPITYQWSDVGNWTSFSDLQNKDQDNNSGANTIFLNSRNNFTLSTKKVVLIGINDLNIIDTDNFLLICHKESAEKVKELVDQIN